MSLYWLVTDETNLNAKLGSFFIYGGLIFDADQLRETHAFVEEVRQKYDFEPHDKLKFDTNARPKDRMDVETYTSAKREIIQRAVDAKIKMMVSVVHHSIGGNNDKQLEWAINTILLEFDTNFLSKASGTGVVCVDRLNSHTGFDYLKSRFQEPLSLPNWQAPPLQRIIHYSMSCDGASHISSLVDVALGGFRYCVNAAMGKGAEEPARQIFPPIMELFWKREDGHVGGYGYHERPKKVKVDTYKEDYAKLRKALVEYLGEEAIEQPE